MRRLYSRETLKINLKSVTSDQFLHFRKRTKASFENSGYLRDQKTIIGDRYSLILAAGDAVFHFTFIQHTSATVNHHFIGRNIIRKFCPGSEFKNRLLPGIISNPFGHLTGSDISALTMMRTSFCNQNMVTIFNRRKSDNPFQLSLQFSFISGKKN